MYKRPKDHIECNDYNIGKFNPVSFTPKLNWTIKNSKFIDHPNKLPKQILIEARLLRQNIIIYSSPYSYGLFSVECKNLGFYLDRTQLDTNDPEVAIYLTEEYLRYWVRNNIDFYSRIENKLK